MIFKKYNFLLLEALIALSLIILCVFPMIRFPATLFKNQIQSLFITEYDLIADQYFAQIKTKLYQNTIPIDEIPLGENKKKEKKWPSSKQIIKIGDVFTKEITKTYSLWLSITQKKSSTHHYYIVFVDISLSCPKIKTKKYRYKVFVKKEL